MLEFNPVVVAFEAFLKSRPAKMKTEKVQIDTETEWGNQGQCVEVPVYEDRISPTTPKDLIEQFADSLSLYHTAFRPVLVKVLEKMAAEYLAKA